MVSLRSQKVTDRASSSRKKEAGRCSPSAFGLPADNSSIASSNSSESEASEKTDQLGDLSPNDYSDSDVDSDEELLGGSTQTSVLGSGKGLVNQVIIIDNDRKDKTPMGRIGKPLGLNQYKRKRLDDGDSGGDIIIEDSDRKGSSLVRRRIPRKAASVQSYLESENLWMNNTSRVIDESIENCKKVAILLGTGKPVGEVGGNNTKLPLAEITKLLERQEQGLENLRRYIQRCGASESKITGKWQRAK